ncbi:MAG: cobyrinate a,c-diamide synthase [Desulfatirhabdiaceae bacterium]
MIDQPVDLPRIIISALRGGAGKTILSLGIIGSWKKQGRRVAPFKKGPDYIDAGWLALAAGQPCYNLDTYLLSPSVIQNSLTTHTDSDTIAVIEGNRGLYDGIDMAGSTSTAELAKLLLTPVILCIDCTKSTRTTAAAVLGCLMFDPETPIKGVILNRVSGKRHETMVQKSIEYHCGIPVLGAVPRLDSEHFPERHMGLVPTPEHEWAYQSIKSAVQTAQKYLELDWLYKIALEAPSLSFESHSHNDSRFPTWPTNDLNQTIKIGILQDAAFQFYYPENLEALKREGAELIYFSPLSDSSLSNIDALYIGGGFPETHACRLSQNTTFRSQLKSLAENGLPIYAECGGLMYLGQELVVEGQIYPMAGVLPVTFGLFKRPQGHGYTQLLVDRTNPFFPVGTELKGHEFHYSRVLELREDGCHTAFNMKRGVGLIENRDGFCLHNILATYTHIHALGVPEWATAMMRKARSYRQGHNI